MLEFISLKIIIKSLLNFILDLV